MTQTPEAVSLQSIGAGPFEVPIAGRFLIEREENATVFIAENEERVIRVTFFRKANAEASAERISGIEELTRRSWQRFAIQENLRVTREFSRADIHPALAIFSMASQYGEEEELSYYVQFAVTDGPQLMSLFIEGLGDANTAMEELLPLVVQARPAIR